MVRPRPYSGSKSRLIEWGFLKALCDFKQENVTKIHGIVCKQDSDTLFTFIRAILFGFCKLIYILRELGTDTCTHSSVGGFTILR